MPQETETHKPKARGKRSRQGGKPLAITEAVAVVYPYKGTRHRASLRPDGTVLMGGVEYKSPSAAGKAITGTEVNGWQRWRYTEGPGSEAPIGNLRRSS